MAEDLVFDNIQEVETLLVDIIGLLELATGLQHFYELFSYIQIEHGVLDIETVIDDEEGIIKVLQ